MKVLGTGVGRTGTYSLRLALNELGFGPCHHMDEVLENPVPQIPLWSKAVAGNPDWPEIYAGYQSAVDWPTARFYQKLSEAYPSAKFIHTIRSADSWAASFSSTIYKVLNNRSTAPPEAQPWLDMCAPVIEQTGFVAGLDERGLANAFEAHTQAVVAAIPTERLMIFEVSSGWEPLCSFLGVPVPSTPFPRTNNRVEFFDLIPWKV